jgi:hypothetical protein
VGGLRRAADELDEARPGGAHVLGHAVPQLDRALVVGVGLGEGGEPQRLGARQGRGRERRRQVVGREPVEGELRGGAAGGDRERRIGLEGPRQRGVQRAALARQQVVGQRLAHERVAEAVGPGLGVRDDDVVRHRLAQSGDELVGGHTGRALEQPVADPRAGDGREAQHGLCWRAQGLDAQHERVGQVGRQALAAGGGRQLLGEERVALGAREELVDQARLGPAAEDPGQLRHHLLAREALERHALDDGGALGLGHQRAQGMAAVQLVGAVGGEEQDALLARVAHEEGQEVARGAVGPVDVLEDEHERLRLGQAPQQREQQLEDAPLRGRRLRGGGVELGQQRGEADRARAQLVGAQPAQGADDGREGQLAVAEIDAVADEDSRALRTGAGAELGDEASLADPRLAGDERDRGPAIGRALEGRREARELTLAPHELRTRDPLGQLPRPSTGRVYAAGARALVGRR